VGAHAGSQDFQHRKLSRLSGRQEHRYEYAYVVRAHDVGTVLDDPDGAAPNGTTLHVVNHVAERRATLHEMDRLFLGAG